MSETSPRTPPHSAEAEQSLLGGLMMDNAALDRLPHITGADFYVWENRQIFEAISRLVLANKPADVITVHAELARMGVAEDVGGLEYLDALAQCVPGAGNAPAYAGVITDRSRLRAVLAIAYDLQAKALALGSGESVSDIADRAITDLLRVQEGMVDDEPRDIAPLAAEFLDDLQARADGQVTTITTGLRDLDRLTGDGGRRGELWVFGARPSMGKTAFALSLCRHVGQTRRALVLTQEDSLIALTGRHVAAAGRVNLAHIRNPRSRDAESMWTGVTEGIQAVMQLQLSMDDHVGLTLADVRRKVQQIKRRHGDCALVVIDYLQLMQGPGDTKNHILGDIANGLKRLAKELNTWVVLLSQLSREADKRGGPPQMSDLRDSGDIEGAADFVGLLYREHRYKPKPDNKYLAEIHVPKQKNGPTGMPKFFFDGAHQLFGDWSGDAGSAASD